MCKERHRKERGKGEGEREVPKKSIIYGINHEFSHSIVSPTYEVIIRGALLVGAGEHAAVLVATVAFVIGV